MLPYVILICLPIIVWSFGNRYVVKMQNRVLYKTDTGSIDVFMLCFLILLALRGKRCGIDTIQYFRLFNRYGSYSVQEIFTDYNHELGFKLLNKAIVEAGGSFQIVLIITALLCILPLWYYYRKEAEKPILTIALFLTVAPFVMYISGIRQAIAMSIGVFAWYAAKNKKILSFIL